MKNIGVISGKPYICTRNHRGDEILYIVKAVKLRFSKLVRRPNFQNFLGTS